MIFYILLGLVCLILGFGAGMFVMNGQPNYSSYFRVREFHEAFGHPAPPTAKLLSTFRSDLRIDLIQEELDEYKEAVFNKDIVAIADALADLDYVVNGAAVEHGIVLPVITAEVHRSNMTKLGKDGKPIYREDGKILKGPDYVPPHIAPLLSM